VPNTSLPCYQVRLASLAENAFNAVERIREYTVAPEEPPPEIPGACPDSWPSKGEVTRFTYAWPCILFPQREPECLCHICKVLGSPGFGTGGAHPKNAMQSSKQNLTAGAGVQVVFDHVEMRYRPGLPLVLKGLSVTIPAASKCGVVGRTGQTHLFCLFQVHAHHTTR
jgi:ABC-type multidrug transport system fused ATPase/permease subunit